MSSLNGKQSQNREFGGWTEHIQAQGVGWRAPFSPWSQVRPGRRGGQREPDEPLSEESSSGVRGSGCGANEDVMLGEA